MSLKQKVVVNTIWSVSGQLGYSAIQLFSNIVFARFLTPIEFGQLGIIMFFVLISNVLIEGGLGGALVRKINATETDFSTVFLFNLFISLFLYIILILISDHIANYYKDPQLKILLIAAGSITIINSLNFVQNTRLVKSLQFKKLAFYKLISVFLANVVGIVLVILHYGIWSLVAVILLNPLFLSIILWTKEGTFGRITFSKHSFLSLYIFGVNTTLATIIDTIFNNIYQLILAKWFSITQTGFYYQAKKLQDVINTMIFGTTNSVIFSSLATLQNEREKFVAAYSKIISYLSVVMGLLSLLIINYSKEIIMILYGDKWIPASSYLIFLASISFFYVHEMFNRVVFKTFDKTRIILYLELLKKAILAISIVVGVILLDIKALLLGYLIVSCISYFINYFISRKVSGVRNWNELISVFKVIISIVLVTIPMFLIKTQLSFGYLEMIISVPLVLLLYLVILRIQGFKLNLKEFKELNLHRSLNQSNEISD